MTESQQRRRRKTLSQTDVPDRLSSAINSLQALSADASEQDDETLVAVRTIALGIVEALSAVSMSMGECRQDVPFSPMRPVRTVDGTLKWCCNHDPEHC